MTALQLACPVQTRIVDFIERLGIAVEVGEVPDDSFLPGCTVRYGKIIFNPDKVYTGDLLHEAGHIAVSPPETRWTQEAIEHNPAEEMATIAWSYAAALEMGLDPAILFHEQGYSGGGGYLVPAFESEPGNGPGVPLLAWYGMTAEPKHAAARGIPAYPVMTRWFR